MSSNLHINFHRFISSKYSFSLSLFSLERQQRQWDNIIYECYFSLRAVLIHMEKSICFFKVTFCIFSTVTFFISLHSDLLLLLCLCCRQCCCCISLSSLILHRSWFLYNFIFLLKAILTRKLNSECSIQARFSFFSSRWAC